MNSPGSTGVGPYPMNNRDGLRVSTALAYLSLARHRLNLTIRANVVRANTNATIMMIAERIADWIKVGK